tara:strand:- start:2778 stop:3041 length:264 start_codon:yes stop_codon:yes gene_type:complete
LFERQNKFKEYSLRLIRIMFNCKVIQNLGSSGQSVTLVNKNFRTLKEISEELGLTYQQVADLSSRKTKKKYQQFKYFPKIDIMRINN